MIKKKSTKNSMWIFSLTSFFLTILNWKLLVGKLFYESPFYLCLSVIKICKTALHVRKQKKFKVKINGNKNPYLI